MFDIGYDDGGMPSWILDFEPKSALRDLKIQMITTDDVKFSVSDVSIKSHEEELNFLKKTCPNDVISGSLALNLYGLIIRSCNDIDIITKDKDRYSDYNNDDHSYGGDVYLSENRLGHKYHIHRKELNIKNPFFNKLLFPFTLLINSFIKIFGNEYNYKVDYFIDKSDVIYNTFEYKGHLFKIHCPLQIMDRKLDMYLKSKDERPSYRNGDKHKTDLFIIFKNIYFEQFKKGKNIIK